REGLPLALELAAARVSSLGLRQLVERLGDSFRLLVGGSRTAPTRQQTLRATLDWSSELLSAVERVAFSRLAMFAGGWSLEAAEDRPNFMPNALALVHKSAQQMV